MGESSNGGFNQREKAYEAKYLHDEELNFKINAKRNHLFGQWAANELGYAGEKAEKYVDEVIIADLQKSKDATVLSKVLGDLTAANVNISEHRVHKEYERCFDEARSIFMKNKEEDNG